MTGSYINLGHLIILIFICIIHWLKTVSEVPLGKHTMPELERNWMEGTHCFSKTSTNWQQNDSTMGIGFLIVLFSLISTNTIPTPNLS